MKQEIKSENTPADAPEEDASAEDTSAVVARVATCREFPATFAGRESLGNVASADVSSQEASTPPDNFPASPSPLDRAMRKRLARRTFLRRLGWGVGGLAGYGLLLEPSIPLVSHLTISLAELPPAFDGFTIAALSDMHIQRFFPAIRLQPAISAVQRAKPDMIVLLGDYTNSPNRHLDSCTAALSELTAPQGVYAIFGNHDYPDPPHNPPLLGWKDAKIQTIIEDVTEVWKGNERIFLIGLHSAICRPTAPADLLRRTPDGSTRIVLWHEPDWAFMSAAAGASLQLSGHTHGGQVCIPGKGPILLPSLGRKYPSGLYQVGEGERPSPMPLYVTRGIGVLPPYVRFCCPPEVTFITLRCKE
jgi:hypothetical protein